jgi:hypothetical protein
MEQWKTIEGYEDYQVSDLGNIKSFKRGKERILKHSTTHGYLHVILSVNGKQKNRLVHQLVAIAFLNHKPCGHKLVINHKDFNKQNNHVDNLEVVTQRENVNHKHIKSSSEYTGVTWRKERKKWVAQIFINGKKKYLGVFFSEIEASQAYKNALNKNDYESNNLSILHPTL